VHHVADVGDPQHRLVESPRHDAEQAIGVVLVGDRDIAGRAADPGAR